MNFARILTGPWPTASQSRLRKRASADSSTAIVRLRPVAERITALHATVTESALNSPGRPPRAPPLVTAAGNPEYRVYRGEIDAASADAAANDLSKAKWKSRWHFLGSAHTEIYRDTASILARPTSTQFRAVIPTEGVPLNPMTPFPPSSPREMSFRPLFRRV